MRIKLGRVLALAAVVAAGSAFSASAALAPYWQRLRELSAVLADPGLTDALGSGDPIASVTVTADDDESYEIRTEHCSVVAHTVDVEPAPGAEPAAGPRQFSIAFDNAICK